MNEQSGVGRREWLWALVVAVGTAVLTLLPYWLGHVNTPDGRVYLHLIMNPEDSLTYWAKMQQGLQGAWQYTIPFTPEPHEGAFVGVFYVWLGQAARLLGISLTAVWHGSRVVAAILLYVMIFGFTAVFLSDRLTRWTAYLLAVFGSGLGWLLFLSGQIYWLGHFPIDFKQAEAHTFFTTLTFPHTTLGTALILFDMLVLHLIGGRILVQRRDAETQRDHISAPLRLRVKNIWLLAVVAGCGNLLLGIAYPFLIYIVALTAVLYFLYLIYKIRHIPWQAGWQTAVIFLIPAPLYLYYAAVWRTNEIFRLWDAQAGTPSPPWPHYLVGFGVLLLLAGLFWWKRPSHRPHFALLWWWLAAVVLLVYAPLGPQRRFVQGIHVALSILAAAGLVQVVLPRLHRSRIWQRIIANPRYSTAKLSRFVVVLFLLGMSLSNLLLLADVSRVAALTQPELFFRPMDDVAAVTWLKESGHSGVVLGEYETGNFVAAMTGKPVILGHWAETAHYEDKMTAVRHFFQNDTSDDWRQALLTEYHITTIWFGPREQALGEFDPATAVYLTPVYQNDTITLYAFSP